ncbi:MAG: hypothetical protein WC375_11740, partial [Methanomassiliicoccales archaeon]
MEKALHRCWTRIAFTLIAAILVLACFNTSLSPIGNASAASYSFSLTSEEVNVTVLRDGSIDIDYHFIFTNVNGLDGVDVGLPNTHYDPLSAYAIIIVDGVVYSPDMVHDSPYIDVGMAVEFGSNLQSIIEDHGSFELFFHVNNPHMVYENELIAGTVGVSFRPTWFDPSAQVGITGVLTSRLVFPEGFTNMSQALWIESNVWDELVWDNSTQRVVATWANINVDPNEQADGAYDFGAGFPMGYVDQYYLKDAEIDIFADLITLLSLLLPLIIFAIIIAVSIIATVATARRRNGDYYEPKMNVVGAGPRRDLTAVEAAIVLERPLEMVATMILFGLIKKGKVEIVSRDAPMRLKVLSQKGDYQYETEYLNAINPNPTVSSQLLKNTLDHLIDATS